MTQPTDPHRHDASSSSVVRETHTERRSGTTLAFIVGGLVVAVAVIAWLLFGGGDADLARDAGGDIAVTVEGAESAAEGAAESIEGAAETAGEAVEGAAAEVEAEVTTGN